MQPCSVVRNQRINACDGLGFSHPIVLNKSLWRGALRKNKQIVCCHSLVSAVIPGVYLSSLTSKSLQSTLPEFTCERLTELSSDWHVFPRGLDGTKGDEETRRRPLQSQLTMRLPTAAMLACRPIASKRSRGTQRAKSPHRAKQQDGMQCGGARRVPRMPAS